MATGSCLKDKVWQSQQSGHSSLTRELRVAQTLTLAKEHQGHPGSDSPSLSGNRSHIHCRFSWSHFFLSWGFGSYRLVSSIKSNISNYYFELRKNFMLKNFIFLSKTKIKSLLNLREFYLFIFKCL